MVVGDPRRSRVLQCPAVERMTVERMTGIQPAWPAWLRPDLRVPQSSVASAKRQVGEHEHVLGRHGPDVLTKLTKIGKDPMLSIVY